MSNINAVNAMPLLDLTPLLFADLYQHSYQQFFQINQQKQFQLSFLKLQNRSFINLVIKIICLRQHGNLFYFCFYKALTQSRNQQNQFNQLLIAISQQFTYYSNVYLGMIFQKEKRNDLQVKIKSEKNIKTFSVLSLGFMKSLDRIGQSRSRQIPVIKHKDKTSIKTFNNQNFINQNSISLKSSESVTNTSIFNDKLIESSRENYNESICSVENIDLPLLNEDISQRPQILRLDNITNQIFEDPFKKLKNENVCSQLEEPSFDEKQERIYVDMKKKIKKLSAGKKKHFLCDKLKIKSEESSSLNSMIQSQRNHLFPLTSRIYSDSEVIIDGSIFRNKLISQRIDNDVDTDDEQIASGIRRLHKSLLQATQIAQEQRKWEAQQKKIMEEQFM